MGTRSTGVSEVVPAVLPVRVRRLVRTHAKYRPVVIVGRNNGVGLTSDAQLLRAALEEEHAVHYFGTRGVPFMDMLTNRNHLRDAIVLYVERVHALWMPFGHKSALIPNQERYPRRQLWRLNFVDTVFCKSMQAQEVFSFYHRNSVYTGFTSRDNIDLSVQPDYDAAFHLAGKSTFKGTQALLNVWAKHPYWPLLTVVAHPNSEWNDRGAANIRLIKSTLSREELLRLQNSCGLHICPSMAEGWGHYIVEGASCRALVVTTDASPMNEHITNERGCLIRADYAGDRHLGRLYIPAERDIENAMERVLDMDIARRISLGLAARAWYLKNNETCAERLRNAVLSLDD